MIVHKESLWRIRDVLLTWQENLTDCPDSTTSSFGPFLMLDLAQFWCQLYWKFLHPNKSIFSTSLKKRKISKGTTFNRFSCWHFTRQRENMSTMTRQLLSGFTFHDIEQLCTQSLIWRGSDTTSSRPRRQQQPAGDRTRWQPGRCRYPRCRRSEGQPPRCLQSCQECVAVQYFAQQVWMLSDI